MPFGLDSHAAKSSSHNWKKLNNHQPDTSSSSNRALRIIWKIVWGAGVHPPCDYEHSLFIVESWNPSQFARVPAVGSTSKVRGYISIIRNLDSLNSTRAFPACACRKGWPGYAPCCCVTLLGIFRVRWEMWALSRAQPGTSIANWLPARHCWRSYGSKPCQK